MLPTPKSITAAADHHGQTAARQKDAYSVQLKNKQSQQQHGMTPFTTWDQTLAIKLLTLALLAAKEMGRAAKGRETGRRSSRGREEREEEEGNEPLIS